MPLSLSGAYFQLRSQEWFSSFLKKQNTGCKVVFQSHPGHQSERSKEAFHIFLPSATVLWNVVRGPFLPTLSS